MKRITKYLIAVPLIAVGLLLTAKAGHDYAVSKYEADIAQVQAENESLKDENKKMKGDIETLIASEYQSTLQLLQCKGPGLKLEDPELSGVYYDQPTIK